MNLQSIVVLCLAVVVLGGGAWYFTQNSSMVSDESVPALQETETADEVAVKDAEFTGVGSFGSLLGLGQSITCTYSYADEMGSGSGTSYFADGKMRVDATMSTDEGTMDTHMINDGSYVYTWSVDGADRFAMKMPVPDETMVAEDYDTPEMGSESQVSMDQSVEYECDRWSVDTSVFVPPSSVEFMDFGTMMQDALQNMPEGFELPEGFPGVQ